MVGRGGGGGETERGRDGMRKRVDANFDFDSLVSTIRYFGSSRHLIKKWDFVLCFEEGT